MYRHEDFETWLRSPDVPTFSFHGEQIVGFSNSVDTCPLARWVKHTRPNVRRISVQYTGISISGGRRQPVDSTLQRFIALVDFAPRVGRIDPYRPTRNLVTVQRALELLDQAKRDPGIAA